MNAHELTQLPDNGMIYELVCGELKMMSPAGGRHGRIVNRISLLLSNHVESNNLGIVLAAETGFRLATDPDTVRAPDVAFVTKQRYAAIEDDIGYLPLAPDLAVEVLSPSDRFSDVEEKTQCWLSHGCRLVLVVDPAQHLVFVHRSQTRIEILRGAEVFDADPGVVEWRVSIDQFFL